MVTYRKILLAEDDMDDLAIFEQVLGEKGPDIVLQHAENGLEMIAMLDKMTDGDLPDLIILDQNMPKMTGRESLLFLKDSTRYRHIPVILYSTYQVRDFYRECLDLGACSIVAKPDTLQGYRDMISRFLSIPVGSPA
jgi:CheY-like chemotaxis protein